MDEGQVSDGSFEAFAAWLTRKGDAWVGRAGMAEGCPLACWLADQYGGYWSVGPAGYICVDNVEQRGALPMWARRFYRAVDERFGGLGMIAAYDALSVLLGLGEDGNG